QNLSATHSFVTPTGIIFAPGNSYHTELIRITERSTDLEQIAKVNDVSRKLTNNVYTLEEAYERLKAIEREKTAFPLWLQIVAAAIASGCFLLLLDGRLSDVPAAILA